MFEVGFTEIVLIMGLALLVLGPEKLPGLAEKVGRWTGRARAMARQLRTQLEQEVSIDELTKSRPMQTPPPTETETASPSDAAAGAASTTGEADPTDASASTEPPAADEPHNAPGLDLQTMVSGMEPPPRAAETPVDDTAQKAVQ